MITNSGQIDSWLDRYESKWTILSSARISRSLEEYYEVVKGVDNLSKSVKRRKKRINKLLGIRERNRSMAPLTMNSIPEVEISTENLEKWKSEPDAMCGKLDLNHQFEEMSVQVILSEINDDEDVKCSIVIEDSKGEKYTVPVFLTQGSRSWDIWLCLRILEYVTISKEDIGKYVFLDTYPTEKNKK